MNRSSRRVRRVGCIVRNNAVRIAAFGHPESSDKDIVAVPLATRRFGVMCVHDTVCARQPREIDSMGVILHPTPEAGSTPVIRPKGIERSRAEPRAALVPSLNGGVDGIVHSRYRSGGESEMRALRALGQEAASALLDAVNPLHALNGVVGDVASRGWQGVEKWVSTGSADFGKLAPETVDANRATVRHKIGELADVPGLPSVQRAIASAYRDYDRLPHSVRGALDVALDTTADPLTYATLGRESLASMATKLEAATPHVLEALERAGPIALRSFDEHIAPQIERMLGLHGELRPALGGVRETPTALRGRIDESSLLKVRANAENLYTRRTVAAHEAVGGHSVERHVAKSDNWLRKRMVNDGDIEAVSTFTSETAANRAQGAFVKKYRDEISAWLKLNDAKKPIFTSVIDMGQPIGRILERESNSVTAASKAYCVIVRDKSPQGWHFLSSFPVK